jgi:hypothetical protein
MASPRRLKRVSRASSLPWGPHLSSGTRKRQLLARSHVAVAVEPAINPPPRAANPDHTPEQRSRLLPPLARATYSSHSIPGEQRGGEVVVNREGRRGEARCSSRASAWRARTCGTARRRSSRSTGTTRRSWCTRARTAPPDGSSAPSPSSTTSGPAPPSPSSGTYETHPPNLSPPHAQLQSNPIGVPIYWNLLSCFA